MKQKLPVSIAKEIGVTPSYIYKINAGQRRPHIKLIPKIIAAMAARGVRLQGSDLLPELQELQNLREAHSSSCL